MYPTLELVTARTGCGTTGLRRARGKLRQGAGDRAWRCMMLALGSARPISAARAAPVWMPHAGRSSRAWKPELRGSQAPVRELLCIPVWRSTRAPSCAWSQQGAYGGGCAVLEGELAIPAIPQRWEICSSIRFGDLIPLFAITLRPPCPDVKQE